MGNHNVGEAFAAAADVFWLAVQGSPSKELTLKALEAVGNRCRGADAEFDDELHDGTTPLGRMVAIAFDASPQELSADDDGDAWFEGPYMRFRQHFDFC